MAESVDIKIKNNLEETNRFSTTQLRKHFLSEIEPDNIELYNFIYDVLSSLLEAEKHTITDKTSNFAEVLVTRICDYFNSVTNNIRDIDNKSDSVKDSTLAKIAKLITDNICKKYSGKVTTTTENNNLIIDAIKSILDSKDTIDAINNQIQLFLIKRSNLNSETTRNDISHSSVNDTVTEYTEVFSDSNENTAASGLSFTDTSYSNSINPIRKLHAGKVFLAKQLTIEHVLINNITQSITRINNIIFGKSNRNKNNSENGAFTDSYGNTSSSNTVSALVPSVFIKNKSGNTATIDTEPEAITGLLKTVQSQLADTTKELDKEHEKTQDEATKEVKKKLKAKDILKTFFRALFIDQNFIFWSTVFITKTVLMLRDIQVSNIKFAVLAIKDPGKVRDYLFSIPVIKKCFDTTKGIITKIQNHWLIKIVTSEWFINYFSYIMLGISGIGPLVGRAIMDFAKSFGSKFLNCAKGKFIDIGKNIANGKIAANIKTFVSKVKDIFSKVKSAIKTKITNSKLYIGIKDFVSKINSSYIRPIKEKILNLKSSISEKVLKFKTNINKYFSEFTTKISKIKSGIREYFSKWFAKDGIIRTYFRDTVSNLKAKASKWITKTITRLKEFKLVRWLKTNGRIAYRNLKRLIKNNVFTRGAKRAVDGVKWAGGVVVDIGKAIKDYTVSKADKLKTVVSKIWNSPKIVNTRSYIIDVAAKSKSFVKNAISKIVEGAAKHSPTIAKLLGKHAAKVAVTSTGNKVALGVVAKGVMKTVLRSTARFIPIVNWALFAYDIYSALKWLCNEYIANKTYANSIMHTFDKSKISASANNALFGLSYIYDDITNPDNKHEYYRSIYNRKFAFGELDPDNTKGKYGEDYVYDNIEKSSFATDEDRRAYAKEITSVYREVTSVIFSKPTFLQTLLHNYGYGISENEYAFWKKLRQFTRINILDDMTGARERSADKYYKTIYQCILIGEYLKNYLADLKTRSTGYYYELINDAVNSDGDTLITDICGLLEQIHSSGKVVSMNELDMLLANRLTKIRTKNHNTGAVYKIKNIFGDNEKNKVVPALFNKDSYIVADKPPYLVNNATDDFNAVLVLDNSFKSNIFAATNIFNIATHLIKNKDIQAGDNMLSDDAIAVLYHTNKNKLIPFNTYLKKYGISFSYNGMDNGVSYVYKQNIDNLDPSYFSGNIGDAAKYAKLHKTNKKEQISFFDPEKSEFSITEKDLIDSLKKYIPAGDRHKFATLDDFNKISDSFKDLIDYTGIAQEKRSGSDIYSQANYMLSLLVRFMTAAKDQNLARA